MNWFRDWGAKLWILDPDQTMEFFFAGWLPRKSHNTVIGIGLAFAEGHVAHRDSSIMPCGLQAHIGLGPLIVSISKNMISNNLPHGIRDARLDNPSMSYCFGLKA